MPLGEFEQQPDNLVLHEREPLGAQAAAAVFQQQPFGDAPAFGDRALELLRDGAAQLAFLSAMALGESVELGRKRLRINQRDGARGASNCERGRGRWRLGDGEHD